MEYTILAVDIENYSGSVDSEEMGRKRATLQQIIREGASAARLDRYSEAVVSHIDTGDGFFILMDTQDYGKVLAFLDYIRAIAAKQTQLRARAICHTGDCEATARILDEVTGVPPSSSYVGRGIIDAARYVDSDTIRALLAAEGNENLVFALTRELYERTRNQPYVADRSFVEYSATAKNFAGTLYIDESFSNRPRERVVVQEVEAAIDEKFLAYLDTSSSSQYLDNLVGMDGEKFYVFPELSRDFNGKFGSERVPADEYLREMSESPRNVLVVGSEQAGKTELAKEAFRLLHETGRYLPILLRLDATYSGKMSNKIEDAAKKQYGGLPIAFDDTKKILLIDDFHLVASKYHQRIVDELDSMANVYHVLIVDDVYNVNFVGRELIDDFEIVTIQEFSSAMRFKFLESWLERNHINDQNYAVIDGYNDFVNTALMRGLVPATPLNVLVIAAEKMAYNPLRSSVTSRGHCYQTLIYLALKRAAIDEGELDIFLNVLENLSFDLFSKGHRHIGESEYSEFLDAYRSRFNLPISNSQAIEKLNTSRVFSANSLQEYAFASKYMFYFFVARYLANHKHGPEIRRRISDIYANLQLNENGYIGVFIVHHLKDPDILEDIVLNLMVMYDSYEEASLDQKETEFLAENVSSLAQVTMTEYNRSRQNRLQAMEESDRNDRSRLGPTVEADGTIDQDDFKLDEEFASVRKALKTAEVMGHILKSRTGSFPLVDQRSYYEQAVRLYLRITYRFLSDFRKYESEFIDFFADRIRDFPESEKLDREKLYELSATFYFNFNLANYIACIQRSTNTLASQPILEVVKDVCDSIGTPLATMLRLHASMWLTKQVPVNDLKTLYSDGNGFVRQLIRRLLVQYCDMHDIDRSDKQRIASLFQIDLKRMLIPGKK
jgi:hypothetical protein